MVFGSRVFGRCLDLDEVTGLELCDDIGAHKGDDKVIVLSWPCEDTVRRYNRQERSPH